MMLDDRNVDQRGVSGAPALFPPPAKLPAWPHRGVPLRTVPSTLKPARCEGGLLNGPSLSAPGDADNGEQRHLDDALGSSSLTGS